MKETWPTDENSKMAEFTCGSYDHSQTTQTEMVRAHNKIIRACQDNHARNSPRREKMRQTEKKMGRQHPGMDGLNTGRRHEESGETRGVEGACCQVICGAPTVH